MLQVAATDASIFPRFSSDDLVIFELASTLSMVTGFRDTYGMRFVGLEDPGSSVYTTYRVPDPEAPYPQDIVIDPSGIVRYWSWEYDPQEVLHVIEQYANTDCRPCEDPIDPMPGLLLAAPEPTVFARETTVRFQLTRSEAVRLVVYDAAGRLVRILADREFPAGPQTVVWNGRDPSGAPAASGVYFINLASDDATRNRAVVVLR